jgi:hypothetical protein
MNGLQRFCCESCIYTPNSIFYINSPSFANDKLYEYWDVGFLDIKNLLFYETGILTLNLFDKNHFFYDWINLLQFIIDKKIYSKIFEVFDFEKGHLIRGDRLAHEAAFLRSSRNITNDSFSNEFMMFFCDLMKLQSKMISYSLLKKKICSNLKNFKDNLKITFNGNFRE